MLYSFKFDLNWELINKLSEVDKFGGSWADIERRERQTLKQLKSIATVKSVGASTRIEGSKMTDAEVQVLLDNLKLSKLEDRDQQEVAGYFEVFDAIAESYKDIEISENSIKGLHNLLLKYSEKDHWHKGNYKQHSNVVEATRPDESKQVVFQTSEPGFETDDAMRRLVEWYNNEHEAHPVVRSAAFVYDFLSIHPFQDGNGRLSRLLGILLLLKHNYSWTQYVSFEHEIENRKAEYYNVLMQCQRQRPGENINPWVMFFLSCLASIQHKLINKLEGKSSLTQMTPREKKIYDFIESHPGAQSGEIAEKLGIPLPTVKRVLTVMVSQKFLQKHGIGIGTNYTAETMDPVKTDLLFTLTSKDRKKEFTFMNRQSFIELKKILLAPKFQWVMPDEWSGRLMLQGLYFQVICRNSRGAIVSQAYSISAYNNPMYFQPVFTIPNPIIISADFWDDTPVVSDYPIHLTIELLGNAAEFDFDVRFVYDALI